MSHLIVVTIVLFLIAALASAEKSPPRKALPPPCEVQCLEAKNAALQKLAVKRLKLLSAREHKIVRLMVRLRRVVDSARGRPQPGGIAHRSGWLCIHRGEGAWDSNTGNGYYGGLQAHLDWYGVHRMDKLSAEQQMAHAESVYRSTGYSRSWLAGQWPNTYPPCAGLF